MRELNYSQKIAVEHFKNPMLVLAGPGSGKTTVIIERVKNLIETHQVSPWEILVISFTKASAVEMEQRFHKMEGCQYLKPTFGTFHSFFFRILRDSGRYGLNQVLDEEERWTILRNIIRSLELNINDEEEYIKGFFAELSKMKNDLIELKFYHPFQMPKDSFDLICKCYDRYKSQENKIDFDDMLTECYLLLTHEPEILEKWRQKYRYILIDEFQDVNRAQYECIRLLAHPENNLFVVGDDDQSIYQFRGARPEFLLNFEKDFKNCEKVVLDVNYRSVDTIITASSRLIQNNKKRYNKNFRGTGKTGEKPQFFSVENVQEEAEQIAQRILKKSKEGIPYKEMAVLLRTNIQATNFTGVFMKYAIPYYLKDKVINIYDHWIAKDLIAYVNLALNEEDNHAFLQIVNKPKRYVSKELLKKLQGKEGAMIKNIFALPELKTWQTEPIMELKHHLTQIRKRKPYEALKYIRNIVGYDQYLQEYAGFRKTNALGMKEMAEELMESIKKLSELKEIPEYIRKLSEDLKENTKQSKKPLENAVTISTLHSAKGLEFEVVFIPSIIEGIIPHDRNSGEEGIEEERRLFYVGLTRAKKTLYLSEILNRYDKETVRSQFMIELGVGKRKAEKKK